MNKGSYIHVGIEALGYNDFKNELKNIIVCDEIYDSNTLHATLLYSYKDITDEFNIHKYLKETDDDIVKERIVDIKGVEIFGGNNKNFKGGRKVLVFEVHSEALKKINTYIMKNTTADVSFPDYKMHITFAVLNPDTSEDLTYEKIEILKAIKKTGVQFRLGSFEQEIVDTDKNIK